jgi:putative membrane protein
MIPGFFQAINPYLPMSYVVVGMRQTVSGGDLATAANCAVTIVAFGLAALAVTAVAAWRKLSYTMERLHPSLSL